MDQGLGCSARGGRGRRAVLGDLGCVLGLSFPWETKSERISKVSGVPD